MRNWPTSPRPAPESTGLRRWSAFLPVAEPGRLPADVGGTPLLHLPRLAAELGLASLWVKDDGAQPSGTWQSRGMSVAAAAHSEQGAKALAAPCAGSDAVALAAACHRLGLRCRVALPTSTIGLHRFESKILGARVIAVLGDHGTAVEWLAGHPGSADEHALTPFAEPFRVEGEKTLALEVLDALSDPLDALIVPAGTGLELAGAGRALVHAREAGRLEGPGPRIIAVQSEACSPLVTALTGRSSDLGSEATSRRTLAEDLRVPGAAHPDAVAAVRDSGGAALAVSEASLLAAIRKAAASDAVLLGPEGGAGLAGLITLRAEGDLAGARVVLVNPTSLHRSPETLAAAAVG